jgi:DNA-binding response OmpR family regulator
VPRLLLFEDEDDVRETMKETFVNAGYEVETAALVFMATPCSGRGSTTS